MIMREFGKLRGEKITLLLLVVLLMANAAFTVYFSLTSESEQDRLLYAASKTVSENEIGAAEYYEELQKELRDYKEALEKWEHDPESPHPSSVVFPHTYNDQVDDYEYLNAYYSSIVTAADRKEEIEKLLKNSRTLLKNYSRSGYDENSYSVRRIRNYIAVYSAIEVLEERAQSPVFGWNDFFSYEGVGLFAALAGILLGTRLFLCERNAGMHCLLRATKRGRGRLAIQKICFSAVCSLVICVLLFASSLLCIAACRGLSSPFVPLWRVDGYLLCPYDLNVVEALIIKLLLSCLTTVFFALFAAAADTLFRRVIPALLSALLLFGAEYLLLEGDGFLSVFNALSPLRFKDFFGQWKDVPFFSYSLSALLFSLLFFTFILLFSALAVVFWSKGKAALKSRALHVKKPINPHLGDASLLKHEARKVFSTPCLALLLLLMILKIGIDASFFDGSLTFYDQRKQMYTEEYAGLSLEEREAAVTERLSLYAYLLSEETVKQKGVDYLDKTITYAEYEQFRSDHAEAESHQKTLTAYAAELRYLISKKAQTGVHTEVVSDRGFTKLFERDFDLLLYIAVVLTFCSICAREYETKFRPIQRCCANGRMALFRRKLFLTLLCAAIFSLFSFGTDLVFVFSRYDMSLLARPLFCSMNYASTTLPVSFGGYLLIVFGLRTFGTLLLGIIVFSLSELMRSSWITAIGSAALLLPWLLEKLSVPVPHYLNFSLLLSGDRLWRAVSEQGSILFLILDALPIVIVSVIGLLLSRRNNN